MPAQALPIEKAGPLKCLDGYVLINCFIIVVHILVQMYILLSTFIQTYPVYMYMYIVQSIHINVHVLFTYTSQDILVTQSEYVKHELIRLRQSLQELEDRASTIETDIRNAMSEGECYCVYIYDVHIS